MAKAKTERVQLDTAAVATQLGVAPASVRRYRVADRDKYGFPPPDGYIGRSPWWWDTTIDEWVAGRPGKGAGAGRPRKQQPAPEPEPKRTRKAR